MRMSATQIREYLQGKPMTDPTLVGSPQSIIADFFVFLEEAVQLLNRSEWLKPLTPILFLVIFSNVADYPFCTICYTINCKPFVLFARKVFAQGRMQLGFSLLCEIPKTGGQLNCGSTNAHYFKDVGNKNR